MPDASYAYTGAYQTVTVPAGCTGVTVDLQGAGGGLSYDEVTDPGVHPRSAGARVQATIPVTPGDTLYVYVGQQGGDALISTVGAGGWNGGADGGNRTDTTGYTAGGGGGATDVRLNGTTAGDRIAVAGGAGGNGGHNEELATVGDGGDSETTGENGRTWSVSSTGNAGGGHSGGTHAGDLQPAGTTTDGSVGGSGSGFGAGGGGGGGGGGYGGGQGGGLGYKFIGAIQGGGGGGGGGNYTAGTATDITETNGYNTGNGSATLTWELAPRRGTISHKFLDPRRPRP